MCNFVRTHIEICAGNIYDGEKADVWSIGVLLYMMVVGEYPVHKPQATHGHD